ncbi:hypothetical protein HDU76_004056, partial [Blyttiomyces sp. JEL0837]
DFPSSTHGSTADTNNDEWGFIEVRPRRRGSKANKTNKVAPPKAVPPKPHHNNRQTPNHSATQQQPLTRNTSNKSNITPKLVTYEDEWPALSTFTPHTTLPRYDLHPR